jgi:hypothetical protein
MSPPIRDDDADKSVPSDSPWANDAEQQDETLRLQEEVIAAAHRLERQSLERESWLSLERESRALEFHSPEPRRLPESLAFQEPAPLYLQTARPRFELALQSENRFSLQESPRGLWAPTLDPIAMPPPQPEKFGLPSPGLVVGLIGAVGVAAAVALVIVHTLQLSPAAPGSSADRGAGKNRSFAAVAENLPRIAEIEPKAAATTSAVAMLAAVPPSQVALAKPSMMAPPPAPTMPPPAPTVEAAAKQEPAQPEPAKSSPSLIPEPRASETLSHDEIASLFKRGQDMIAGGDIASGRLMLTRAAQAGNAEASLALAGTFDAVILANLRVIGVQPDPAKARAWYMRAAEQGSLEAKRRLEQSALR